MDSEYKPGLVSASLSQGKQKKSIFDPFLAKLFGKKSDKKPKTVYVYQQNEVVKGATKKSKKAGKINSQSSPSQEADIQTVSGKKRKKATGAQESEPKLESKRKKLNEGSEQETIKSKKQKSIQPNGMDTTESTPAPKKAKKSSNGVNDFPYVHESLLKSSPKKKKAKGVKGKKVDDEDGELTRNKRKRDKTADKRTIFVGNCSLSSDKKVITKLFREYGEIESMRFRCGPVAKLEVPKRAAVIKKEFHENANNFVCYVVFKEEESAKKALEKNGHIFKGLHLRVDMSSDSNKHDKKRSVFVGNLPFTVSEEDLRSHFDDCGAINNVRIVRDRQTSIGKGIAYVQFETKDGVALAKKLNGSDFEGRKLRVMTCTNKPKPDKAADKFGKSRKPNQTSREPPSNLKRRVVFAPSNRKSSKSFIEMLQAKKEKRLTKIKKKKANAQKSDGLSHIFGDMPADMKTLKLQNPKLREKKVKDKRKIKAKEKKDRKSEKNKDS